MLVCNYEWWVLACANVGLWFSTLNNMIKLVGAKQELLPLEPS